jgi:hypothetical protein
VPNREKSTLLGVMLNVVPHVAVKGYSVIVLTTIQSLRVGQEFGLVRLNQNI